MVNGGRARSTATSLPLTVAHKPSGAGRVKTNTMEAMGAPCGSTPWKLELPVLATSRPNGSPSALQGTTRSEACAAASFIFFRTKQAVRAVELGHPPAAPSPQPYASRRRQWAAPCYNCVTRVTRSQVVNGGPMLLQESKRERSPGVCD